MTQPISNPVGDAPGFGVIYAPSKTGKTTDILYSFPCAFFIATPAALKPSIGIVGFQPHPTQVREVDRISAATKLIKTLPAVFDSVVVDDFSLLAERTIAQLEKVKTGFKLWGALRDEVLEFRDEARRCGKHVILTCHEAPPRTMNGALIRGGPKLPGKLPEDLPAQCDFVLRAFNEPSRPGPWPMVYRCSPADVGFISGDRFGVTPDYAPMNVGEIFRAANFKVKRAPGLEWMEAVVERGAQLLAQHPVEMEIEVFKAMRDAIERQFTRDPRHITWALRDASDRATLRAARTRNLDAFFAPRAAPGFGASAPFGAPAPFGAAAPVAPAPAAPAPFGAPAPVPTPLGGDGTPQS